MSNCPILRKWGVKKLTWEEDTEPYALARDDRIRNVAKVIVCIGRTRPTVVVGTREVSLNRFFKILKTCF